MKVEIEGVTCSCGCSPGACPSKHDEISLVNNVMDHITEKQFDKIKAIAALDLTKPKQFLVVRLKFDAGEVDEMEVEYKKYLCLIATFPKVGFPISEAVDELWHAHILFTGEYDTLTEVMGHKVHHVPVLSEEGRAKLEPHYFGGTLVCYKQLFGEPNKKWWPHEPVAICWSHTNDEPAPITTVLGEITPLRDSLEDTYWKRPTLTIGGNIMAQFQ